MRTYTSGEVMKMTGLTMRKLMWWDQTGVVVPFRVSGKKKARFRRYPPRAVMFLRLVLYLRNLGYSLTKCRAFMDRIREMIQARPVDLRRARLALFGIHKKWIMLTEGPFVISMESKENKTSYEHVEVIDLTAMWPGQEREVGGDQEGNERADSGAWADVDEGPA